MENGKLLLDIALGIAVILGDRQLISFNLNGITIYTINEGDLEISIIQELECAGILICNHDFAVFKEFYAFNGEAFDDGVGLFAPFTDEIRLLDA